MPDIKTNRPFEERFLDGFDRSKLREEVQKVKPRRLSGLRKKYASWALGGALALGGLGVPMKMVHGAQDQGTSGKAVAPENAPPPTDTAIQSDLQDAKNLADQVATGVQSVTKGVAQGVTQVAQHPLQAVEAAPRTLTTITENVKEHFFKTQVPFGSLIYSEAKKNNLPPELVAAVAHTESKFKPTARSGAGAIGLMQLVPKTGRWLGATNLTDPTQNVMAGAKYLRYLTDRFNGDQQKAIAAYNAGEGAVRRFGGVPPYRETRNYVQRVKSFQHDLGNQIADVAAPDSGL